MIDRELLQKRCSRSLDAVCDLSEAIARAADPTEIYKLILDVVARELGVEKASIMIFDPYSQTLSIAAAHGLDPEVAKKAIVRIGEGISGKVFASHKPVLLQDIKAEEGGPGKDRYKTRSLISAPVTCFPMKVGESALGVINVTDKRDGTPFTDEDLLLLTTLSNQAAAFLHIANLLEEKQMNERLHQQLEIARQIQYKLLPSDPPKIEGIDVAGRLVTAERVGGDYYDYFVADEKRPVFVIADVSGHSIGAALIMAAFRSSIRAQRDCDYSPSELVQRVNSILYEDLFQAEQFISMTYLQYIKSRKIISFTCAGHPPPLVWRNQTKTFEEVGTEDPLLGIEQRAVFHEKQMVVSSGDVIIMFTDGITEARNKEGELFGKKRLCDCLEDAVVGSARQISDVIVETVQTFIDPLTPRDDVTVLVVKVL